MTAAIELRGVSKEYRKYDDIRGSGLLGKLRTRTTSTVFSALRDVDMVIEPGESVGVVGRNGAGKTTLLRMLSGVTAPTSGLVRVHGRIAPLISVGVGFHPEMTGRENVYVNGAILGLSRVEIDQRFDAILAFAELENFIDTPVKFYSSGMFVRLGFAVAVEARPDVLLVDEVLAVGDFAFQLRCFERMNEIRQAGTTIVVVSHNMNAIRGFCDRAVLLHRGVVAFDGATFDAVARYFDLVNRDESYEGDAGQAVELEEFALYDGSGRPTSHVTSGEEVAFRFTVVARKDLHAPFQWIGVESESGLPIYSDARFDTPMPALRAGQRASFEARVTVRLPTGNYTARSALHELLDLPRTQLLASAPPLSFYVTGRDTVHGVMDLEAEFAREGAP